MPQSKQKDEMNKAGYTAILVACGWAGAMIGKWTQNAYKRQKSKLETNQPTDRRKPKQDKLDPSEEVYTMKQT